MGEASIGMFERKLFIKDNPMMRGKELYIYTELSDGKVRLETRDGDIATSRDYDRYEAIPHTLMLRDEDLQLLADELQRLNIRPREAGKTEGLYEAQSSHLSDLRQLLKLK